MAFEYSGPTPELSDAALLAAIADQKPWALAKLYDRYAHVLYGLALKIMAESALAQDVVHDAFLSIWRKATRYDEKRGDVGLWLLMLCRNLAIDRYRQKMNMANRHANLESVAPLLLQSGADPESETLAAEDGRLLGAALEKLPAAQKKVIEMAYYHGMCQREIAESLNAPLGTVKTRTRQALKKLRSSLRV